MENSDCNAEIRKMIMTGKRKIFDLVYDTYNNSEQQKSPRTLYGCGRKTAGGGGRTHNLKLGKLALCQLSYARDCFLANTFSCRL